MGRFIVVVLDSFGVGQMLDVPVVRPRDKGANTARHILQAIPSLNIPNLLRLGLINCLEKEIGDFHYQVDAVYGKAELMHYGADSFLGHQEIMGTHPQKPLNQAFRDVIDEVKRELELAGYHVRKYPEGRYPKILIVNECVTVGDNLETDLGQVFNVSSCLDYISFKEVVDIGKLVRSVVKVSRVITFGGKEINLQNLLDAHKIIDDKYSGVDAPLSGVYDNGYQVIHLGYGINPEVQITSILDKDNIPVVLAGKVADIIQTKNGRLFPGVDTQELFNKFIGQIKEIEHGFFCLNIQETDLAGHAEDENRYAEILSIADRNIEEIIRILNKGDVLIVTADHGNDPTIGHSQHTREYVPLLISSPGVTAKCIGVRKTMSDTAATAAEYFNVSYPQDGTSYFGYIEMR